MIQSTTHDVLVIGAGIVGISTALALRAQGRNVTVWDRKGIAQEASRGNAGAFAFTEIEPLAAPGVMKKAPKWLLDPLGPLSVPPSYALQIAPWMLRFWRASWRDRYNEVLKAQVALMRHCQTAFERQLARDGNPDLILREGQMSVYSGEKEFQSAATTLRKKQEFGIEVELIKGASAIAERQPGLSPQFTHAAFTPEWINTCDPARWAKDLAEKAMVQGVVFETETVSNLHNRDCFVEVQSSRGMTTAQQVVLCAGAWSHRLIRGLGDQLPLETERGYNTTLPGNALDLRTHVTFSAHGFVVSKNGDGIRVGGAVELGGLDLAPNYQRAQVLLDKAKRFFPALETDGGTQWMGFRPSMPDSLPVIGPSPNAPRVVYGFGHGHLGLTQSAGTAELLASLVQGHAPAIDITPYRANRF